MWSRNWIVVSTFEVPVPGATSTRICVSRVLRTTTVIGAAPVSCCEFLGDRTRIERAGVKCHPDDGRGDAAIGELAKIRDGRDAARRDHGMHGKLGHIFHEKEVGTGELSLAMHGGDEHAAEWNVVELLDGVEYRAQERACPTACHDLPLAHISGDDQLPGKR